MPIYEYRCEDCEIEFEEYLYSLEDISKYKDSHPCPQCSSVSHRIASMFGFAFKAPSGQTQGSGVHGNSGVHDLDYPSLDKAVGRSANKKWSVYNEQQAERDKVRRETGASALTVGADGKAKPMDAKTADQREKVIKTFKAAKTSKD